MHTAFVEPAQGLWVYVAACEEYPVTFQMGVVAADGVILASDKRGQHRTGTANSSSLVNKIKCLEDRTVVYCWSGDDGLMSAVANKFVALIGTEKRHSETARKLLEEAGWVEWEQRYGSRLAINEQTRITHSESSLLLARLCTDGIKLFRLGFSRTPSANLVHDKTVEGDLGNSAAFFIERYYDGTRTVDGLLPIVAHCILMARKLNGQIEGLELAICTRDKCEILKDLAKFTKLSDRLDGTIAKELGL